MSSHCTTCGNIIENDRITGIFCASCYGDEISNDTGWRALVSPPAAIALGASIIPATFEFNINGVNYVAAIGGVIAVFAAVVAISHARKKQPPARTKHLVVAGVALLFGALVFLGSGLLALAIGA